MYLSSGTTGLHSLCLDIPTNYFNIVIVIFVESFGNELLFNECLQIIKSKGCKKMLGVFELYRERERERYSGPE